MNRVQMTEQEQLSLIRDNTRNMKTIANPTENAIKFIIDNKICDFRYVPKDYITDDIYIYGIKKDIFFSRYVPLERYSLDFFNKINLKDCIKLPEHLTSRCVIRFLKYYVFYTRNFEDAKTIIDKCFRDEYDFEEFQEDVQELIDDLDE